MILSDKSLLELINSGKLGVEPFEPENLQPGSLDCRIGSHFLSVDPSDTDIISMDKPITYREIEGDKIILQPHSFILATTIEYVRLPANITAFVEGRSSIGRIGLFIQNAGWVDAGFEGRITLELYNANSVPIEICAGRRVCQLVFCQMDQAASRPYQGKYQKQEQSVGSRIFKDNEIAVS